VSTETRWLRDRVGKEEPRCPLLRLVDVQSDTGDGNFPDAGLGHRNRTGNNEPEGAHLAARWRVGAWSAKLRLRTSRSGVYTGVAQGVKIEILVKTNFPVDL
jgi:hypothetical protein